MGIYWFIFGLGLIAGGVMTPFVVQWVKEWQDRDAIQRRLQDEKDRRASIVPDLKQLTCCGAWVKSDVAPDHHLVKFKYTLNPEWGVIPDLTDEEQKLLDHTWAVGVGKISESNPRVLDMWVEDMFPNEVLIAPIVLRSFTCDYRAWSVPLPNETHIIHPIPKRFELDRKDIRRVNTKGVTCDICGHTIAKGQPKHRLTFGVLPRDPQFDQYVLPLIKDQELLNNTNIWFDKPGLKPGSFIVAWRSSEHPRHIIFWAEAVARISTCSSIVTQSHPNFEFLPKEVGRIKLTILEQSIQTLDVTQIDEYTRPLLVQTDQQISSDSGSEESTSDEEILVRDSSEAGSRSISRSSDKSVTKSVSPPKSPSTNNIMLAVMGPSMVGKSLFLTKFGPSFVVGDGKRSTTTGVKYSRGEGSYNNSMFADFMGFEDTRMPSAIMMYRVLNDLVPIVSKVTYLAPILMLSNQDFEADKYIRMVSPFLDGTILILINLRKGETLQPQTYNHLHSLKPTPLILAYNVAELTESELAYIYRKALQHLTSLPSDIGSTDHPWITSQIDNTIADLDQMFHQWSKESPETREPLLYFEEDLYPLLRLFPDLASYRERYLNSHGPVSPSFVDYELWLKQFNSNLERWTTCFNTGDESIDYLIVHKSEPNISRLLIKTIQKIGADRFKFLQIPFQFDRIAQKDHDMVLSYSEEYKKQYKFEPPLHSLNLYIEQFGVNVDLFESVWKHNSNIITGDVLRGYDEQLPRPMPRWWLVSHPILNTYSFAHDVVDAHLKAFPDHHHCSLIIYKPRQPQAHLFDGEPATCTIARGHYIHTDNGMIRCNEENSLPLYKYTIHNMSSPFRTTINLPSQFPNGKWVRSPNGVVYKFQLGATCFHALKNLSTRSYILCCKDDAYYLTMRPSNPVDPIRPIIPSAITWTY